MYLFVIPNYINSLQFLSHQNIILYIIQGCGYFVIVLILVAFVYLTIHTIYLLHSIYSFYVFISHVWLTNFINDYRTVSLSLSSHLIWGISMILPNISWNSVLNWFKPHKFIKLLWSNKRFSSALDRLKSCLL